MRRFFVIILLLTVSLSAAWATQVTPTPELTVWQVHVANQQQAQALADSDFDVLEARGPDYLLVLGDATTATQLKSAGYRVTVDHTIDPQVGLDDYYGGYRTVAEHVAHMNELQTTYPNFVRVVDFGDSWAKTQAVTEGHDMLAVCITADQADHCALTPESPKPRFVLMTAIHARELTTAEVAWRWMDYLLENYGVDPDITALLDHNEMWIIPIANPDGREVVESGVPLPYLQRKNIHDYSAGTCSDPPESFSQKGVDLNRNAAFMWGGASTSTNPCMATYRGPAAASEPEQQALQNLFGQLFVDQRADDLTSAAPITTTGTFISLHSYSDLVLLPWGWVECDTQPCPADQRAPNDAGLRSLGFRMSYFNGYDTGMPSELLYAASGTTDDYTYGMFGVASFTYEIGPFSGTCGGFRPEYDCQDDLFWPQNRDALMYAAVTAREPYSMSHGPSVTLVTDTITDTGVELMARVDDSVYGNNGSDRPLIQAIQAVEYSIDQPPWSAAAATAFVPVDGTFDTAEEEASTLIEFAGLEPGRHEVWIRAQDADGFWGPPAVRWINVPEVTEPEPSLIYVPMLQR